MRGFSKVGGLALALSMSACAAQAPNASPGSPGQAIAPGTAGASAASVAAMEAGQAAIRKVLQLYQAGPGAPAQGRPPSGPPQAQQAPGQQESPFAELAKSRPELKPRIGQLEARLGRLNQSQQKAMAAVMWDDVKDKTMAQMLELSRTWRQQPTTFLERWERMVGQVERMSPQALQAAAASLPPEIAEEGAPGATGI